MKAMKPCCYIEAGPINTIRDGEKGAKVFRDLEICKIGPQNQRHCKPPNYPAFVMGQEPMMGPSNPDCGGKEDYRVK